MSLNVQAATASALTLHQPRVNAAAVMPSAALAGFYLSFRLFFPLLAVRIFGQDAQDGVVLSLALTPNLAEIGRQVAGQRRRRKDKFEGPE